LVIVAGGLASRAGAQSVCQGPPPQQGTVVHGPVLQIDDGSSLCVATGAPPSTWVAIHLPQIHATRATLMAAAFGRTATCVLDAGGIGECSVEGRPLLDELKRPETARDSAALR
jgi:hypothetical protein